MTVGIATSAANSALDTLLNSTYVQLHTGDPGSAGTANVSSTTTRQALSFNSAASGSKGLSSSASWTSWAGTSPETVTHISVWSAVSGGTFKDSLVLSASKTVTTGDTVTLTALTVSLGTLAA